MLQAYSLVLVETLTPTARLHCEGLCANSAKRVIRNCTVVVVVREFCAMLDEDGRASEWRHRPYQT